MIRHTIQFAMAVLVTFTLAATVSPPAPCVTFSCVPTITIVSVIPWVFTTGCRESLCDATCPCDLVRVSNVGWFTTEFSCACGQAKANLPACITVWTYTEFPGIHKNFTFTECRDNGCAGYGGNCVDAVNDDIPTPYHMCYCL